MCAAPAVIVRLVNEGLWKAFGQNNEMIVNKRGRNLFPTLACTVGNLEPSQMYTMSVRMVATDAFKYRFENESWLKQSNATEVDPVRVFMHSDGYKRGMEWMAEAFGFPSLKIGNERNASDMIVLQPHRMYMPQIDVWQLSSDQQTAETVASFRFESTRFIAVTAYKNKHVAELKKIHNKHAAGKRKRSESSEEENQPMKKKCQIHRVKDLAAIPPPAPEPGMNQIQELPGQQNHNFNSSDFLPAPFLVLPHDPYNAINFFEPLPFN